MANSTNDIFTWSGAAGDGAWTNTNNWTVLSGSPAGSKPAAGETAHFGAAAKWPVYSGETGAITIGLLSVTPECRVNIGATTAGVASAITNVNATTIRYGGQGQYCYWSGTGATIEMDKAAGQYVQGAAFTNIRTFSGRMVVSSAATNTSGTIVNRGAEVMVERNGTSVVSFDCVGGVTISKRDYLTANVGGGQFQLVDQAEGPSTNSVLKVFNGSFIDRGRGTRNQIDWYGGEVMTKDNPNPTLVVTTLNNYSGKQYPTRWAGGQATVSSNNNYGGPSDSLGDGAPGTV